MTTRSTTLAREMNNGINAEMIHGVLWIEGHEIPHKRIGNAEQIADVNIAKSLLKNIPLRWSLNRTLIAYNNVVTPVLEPHRLKLTELTTASAWIVDVLTSFLSLAGVELETAFDFALNVAHIAEYDQAYRFRLQDAVSDTSITALHEYPYGEVMRLLELIRERDHSAGDKIYKYGTIAALLLLLPKYRRALRRTVSVYGIARGQMDANDRYWAALKTDYNYGGRTIS